MASTSLFEADGSTNATAVLELMTCRFVVNALIHCATRLGNNLGKKKITDFIVSFDRKFVSIWRCPVPPLKQAGLSTYYPSDPIKFKI